MSSSTGNRQKKKLLLCTWRQLHSVNIKQPKITQFLHTRNERRKRLRCRWMRRINQGHLCLVIFFTLFVRYVLPESLDIVDVTFMTRCVAADNGLIIDVARSYPSRRTSTGMFCRDVIDHYEFSFTSSGGKSEAGILKPLCRSPPRECGTKSAMCVLGRKK